MDSKLQIAGPALPDMPWEERPAGCKHILWRCSANPIIDRYALPTSNSIFNSAVVPFKSGRYNYAGVFRCDDTNIRMRLHAGFSANDLELRGAHDEAVPPPELHVGRLRIVNVPERSVSGVARARQHGVASADFAGEEDTVAIVGQESILQLMKRLEIVRPGDAYGGLPLVAVAPRDVVFAVEQHHARVVAVDPTMSSPPTAPRGFSRP